MGLGRTKELIRTITPYATYTGPVRVAAADVNGDEVADVIVAPSAGLIPRVKVYDGATGDRAHRLRL